mgnify:CR=1 FL=1
MSEASGVASATPIRASAALCGCPSADMSLSDRDRPEGFHRITSTAVAVTPFPASERPEGFHPTTSSAALFAVDMFLTATPPETTVTTHSETQ